MVKATAGYTVFGDSYSTKYTKAVDEDDYTAAANGKSSYALDNLEIVNVGVAFDLAKDLDSSANYMKANDSLESIVGKCEIGDDSYILDLNYRGAKASEAGSWGLHGKYYDQSRPTVVAHTMNGEYGGQGFEGYMVGVNYTFAKNIVGSVEYYDLEEKEGTSESQTIWSQLVFTF